MAITLSRKFIGELGKCSNTPNVIIEMELDSGPVRFGYHGRNTTPPEVLRADSKYAADGSIAAIGSDELPSVVPALKAVSSLQNKIDVRSGYSTRGQLTVVLSGRENFLDMLQNEYLKNRRVVRKDGFVARGFTWLDYAQTFSGKVLDWSRKGDELTIIVADDLKEASLKLPTETESMTSYIEYRAMNPADIMADIMTAKLGIDPACVNLESFVSERDMWLSGWKFNRVLTEPSEANQFLNELQVESNSLLVHDGEKISFKVFAPPTPGQTIDEWTDKTFLRDSISMKAGYRDGFYNRVVVYYDYDESGNDGEENYESAVIAADGASQSPSQWSETSTRTIKSKWIRSRTCTEEPGLDGIKVYHVSRQNGTGTGQLVFNMASMTLVYSAPGGSLGEPRKLTKSGKYQIFDADANRYVRVLVDTSALPQQDAFSAVNIMALGGGIHASALAQKVLSRFRDPVATLGFEVDINCMSSGTGFIKPADMKDMTTEEASAKGSRSWTKNRIMLTSVRPDFASGRVSVEAIETKMSRRYGFIAAAGQPDYGGASSTQRAYGFIGDAANLTGGTGGYYIW